MTMNDEHYDKLDDYLDGVLPGDERRDLEAALAASESLRAELAALRDLRDAAAALPRGIAPERDLWPEIAERLEDRGTAESVVSFGRPGRADRRISAWSYLLAAAAVVLFMLGAPVLLDRGQPPATVTPTQDPLADAPALVDDAEFKRVAAQYLEARNELAALLEERKADIAPETFAVVEENLTVIAAAVGEIQLALAKEPQSRELERMLYAAYRSEVGLLQQAIQLADVSPASNETEAAKGDDNEEA